MATQPQTYNASATWTNSKRFFPNKGLVTRFIRAGTAATFYPGTLFTLETAVGHEGKMIPYTDTLGEFYGILWPTEATRHATNEVQATFMIDGEFHIDDVVLTNSAGNLADVTLNGIKATCKKKFMQQLGFHVQGLEFGV